MSFFLPALKAIGTNVANDALGQVGLSLGMFRPRQQQPQQTMAADLGTGAPPVNEQVPPNPSMMPMPKLRKLSVLNDAAEGAGPLGS